MATIKEDEIGLWVASGGYIARPRGETRFKKGDKIKTIHHRCTCKHGVGKDETCGRGEYLETWLGCGMVHEHKTYEQRKQQYDWYMNYSQHDFAQYAAAKSEE